MKERVGDEKLIIISVAVRGINDHIRFYSILAKIFDHSPIAYTSTRLLSIPARNLKPIATSS